MGMFPLLGMAMMEGLDLRVRVENDGEIAITDIV